MSDSRGNEVGGPTAVLDRTIPRTPTTAWGAARSLPIRMLVLLGILGVAVSATGSWIPSLWGDEAASIMSAERSWESLGRMLSTVDAVHGLYYAILHVWIDLFGASPFSVRFPSAIAIGIATMGVALLATKLAGRTVGLVAAGVFIILPRVTYMGMEARSYAMTIALVVWLMVAFIALVSARERRIMPWVAFGALFALACSLFIYSSLFILVFGVVALVMRTDRQTWLRAGIALGSGAFIALPVVIISYLEREQIAFLASRSSFNVVGIFVSPWFDNKPLAIISWTLIVAGAVIGAVVLLRHRAGRVQPSKLVALFRPAARRLPSLLVVGLAWLVIPTVLLAIGDRFTPLYSPRYLSFTAPAVAILIAVGIVAIARTVRAKWLVPVLAAAVLAAAIPTWVGQREPFAKNGGTDWASVASVIAKQAKPGQAIVFDDNTRASRKPRLAKYMYPEAFAGLVDVGLVTPFQDTDGLWDVAVPAADSTDLVDGYDTVWLSIATPSFTKTPEQQAEILPAFEAAGFSIAHEVHLHRTVLYEMTRG
ncbi:glycosyltransferase family 39 protein [Plantibacter sp. YIM 135249]|uniref:glycosyltransferase family 39 protein n=1 Tax=Plantibacter sp. YIM 135249 TaxID=3423918 RepID=UPI003D335A93